MDFTRVHETKPMGQSRLPQVFMYYVPLVLTVIFFVGCLVVEIFGIEISSAGRTQFYSTFGTVSFIFGVLLNTVYGRNYGLESLKSLIFSFISFQVVFSWISVGWTQLDISVFGVGTVASYRSIMFLPMLCVILSRFCKVDTMNLCDYLTPYFFFHHGFVTIPCWIQGCCAGKPWTWGLVNPLSGMTVFPTQPCIIILSVAVTYWGLYYSKKHNYQANGMVFAGSMCIYGFFRYLIELFTDDPRVFWVMSWLSICSLVMLAFGLIVRYMIGKRMETR